jgi:hypothetical protein
MRLGEQPSHIAYQAEKRERTDMRGTANFKLARDFATLGFVLALLALVGRAEAQSPGSLRYYYTGPTVEESLADEYGQAIIAELARLMSLRAAPDCLSSNNLSADALKQVAGDILTRYGSKVWPLMYPDVSDDAVEAEFAKLVGAQGVSELRSFADDPNVQRVRLLAVPVRRDAIVDEIALAFDRYLRRANLELETGLSPVNSGNLDLQLLTEQRNTLADDEIFKAFFEQASFQRFLELRKALDTAVQQAIEASGIDIAPTHSAFAGVEADLRSACVRLGN